MRLRLIISSWLVLVVSALCLIPASSAYAWGAKGHRIVGLVAAELLTPDTRASIKQLMGSDDLATFALYMDQQKDRLSHDIPGSRDWHFDNAPMCQTKAYEVYCKDRNCASARISEYAKQLDDAHATKAERQFAVFVLAHLIGDIHQPLHAAAAVARVANGWPA
jgi:nuclease S1